MKIPVRSRDGVTILQPAGKITIGIGDIAFREAVDEALAAGSMSLLVDFQKASKMDSSGMAELVAASRRSRSLVDRSSYSACPRTFGMSSPSRRSSASSRSSRTKTKPSRHSTEIEGRGC